MNKRWIVVVFLILSSLYTASVLISSPQPGAPLVIQPERPLPSHPTLPENLYAPAAAALRQGDLQTARQQLDSLASQHPDQAPVTRVVAGLYAHQAGDDGTADDLLAANQLPSGGVLEDWRHCLLAESAARRGDADLARSEYARLIAGDPASPLRPAAFLAAAQLAVRQGQPQAALDLVEQAHRAGVDGKIGEALDRLAWNLGRELAPEARREAGRRLLIEDPLSSDAAQVMHAFRTSDGDMDWNHLLSPREVLRRAESFLAANSTRAALLTLEQVPNGDRGFDWHLLKARTLTRAGSGREALDELGALRPADSRERAALEGERVMALARSGEAVAASASLAELVRTHTAPQLSPEALRGLYKDFLDARLLAPAVDALRLLRRADPLDQTGSAALWERGWRDYQNGDLAAAVSSWNVLAELYPEGGDAQRGRYWQARALEELGRRDEAHALFRQLVATSDTSDFYSRQALAGLGETSAPAAAELVQAKAGPWPAEPLLRRAKLLIDLGLDPLAGREIELVASRANPREVLALKGLILCRQGDQRSGLVLLRDAYPALGGAYQASVPAEVLFAYYPLIYGDQIRECARATGLPGFLIAGIIRQESAFDPRASSPVGARGLMQLMPLTAREMAQKVGVPYAPERLYDPGTSLRLGSVYFRELLDRFGGNVELALASYNGGPNRIQRLWAEQGPNAQLADFLETLNLDESRNYVKRILVLADSYRQLYPTLG
jgi:soluble lytic murein transglycosylase